MKDTTPENSYPDSGSRGFQAPHPGSKEMPRWQTGRLVKAPVFTTRNWFGLLGPGLLLGGGAIGGGEWLMGPAVTAKYGGALMWLATLSIMSQVLYNIEISRYTLYTGEPIFTGKFRTLPGPRFWLIAYIFLDFGAVFPYLAANAATPLAAVLLGGVLPDPLNNDAHWWLLKILGYLIFLAALVPLLIGGKIYNSLRAVMTFKIVVVLGFLSILGIFLPPGGIRRHRRQRGALQCSHQQLHEGSGLGNGASCRSHPQRHRRAQPEPVPRGDGLRGDA